MIFLYLIIWLHLKSHYDNFIKKCLKIIENLDSYVLIKSFFLSVYSQEDLSWSFPKDSPYFELINQQLVRIKESGLMKYIIKKQVLIRRILNDNYGLRLKKLDFCSSNLKKPEFFFRFLLFESLNLLENKSTLMDPEPTIQPDHGALAPGYPKFDLLLKTCDIQTVKWLKIKLILG